MSEPSSHEPERTTVHDTLSRRIPCGKTRRRSHAAPSAGPPAEADMSLPLGDRAD